MTSLVPFDGNILPAQDGQSQDSITAINIASYNELMSIPTVVELPSSMSLKDQLIAVNTEPPENARQPHPVFKDAFYLTTGYIKSELDRIFGNGNTSFVAVPGYPKLIEMDEPITKGRVTTTRKKIMFLFSGILVVRWASDEQHPKGQLQRFDGKGTSFYYTDNPNADPADTEESAKSFAHKDAARWIGVRFGKGLIDIINAGKINGPPMEELDKLIADSIGTRLRWSTNGEDHVFSMDDVAELAIQYGGGPIQELTERGRRNLAGIIKQFPTVDAKVELMERAHQLGLNPPINVKYSVLMGEVAKREKEVMDSSPLG